jgi:quinoprotein glucose dehydrogenase
MPLYARLRLGLFLLAALPVLVGCGPNFDATQATEALVRDTTDWAVYGGGNGQRFTALDQIDPTNVADLEIAWVHRHGDVSDGSAVPSTTAFQVTPIVADGRLFYCTPFNRVFALDPLTGGELWRFDPEIDLSGRYANQLVCRGVAYWKDPDANPAPDTSDVKRAFCSARVFTATNDGYLIALDAATGELCPDFGTAGRVNLNRGVGDQEWLGEYQVTSAPTVISGGVVVGAAISDNARIDAPSGVVRSFDVRTGVQRWAWDLAPPDFDYETGFVSDEGYALGTPNVWGTMVADHARDLLIIPTGNPAPDYYRSGTPDMDYYGTSVVAVRGATGEVVWHFRTVINDFWDYDVGGQPSLADLEIAGKTVAAVVAGTKMGFIFVLDRDTGQPLIDVEYREVPQEGPLADQLSPVQPFPPDAFRVAKEITADDAWGLTFWDEGKCREILETARVGPIYTPITEQWTFVAPSHLGGINWGGVAVDPERGLIAARNSNGPARVRLIPREDFGGRKGFEFVDEVAEQRGTPYAMAREFVLSPLGVPCTAPPWGEVGVIDVAAETRLWQQPHGTVRDVLAPIPLPPIEFGLPGLGGPMLTRT